jgi:ADP-heptose:LPS heptosyltransferase
LAGAPGDWVIHGLSPPSRILLIRLREIGDVVFTTPAIGAIRRHLPGAHISYVVEPAAASVVASNPNIDDLIVVPRKHLLADVALGWRFRTARYQLVIDFHGGPRASLLTWLSAAPLRVGYAVAGRAWMYTVRVPRPREWRPRHAVQNQWDLLTAIGIPPPDPQTHPVEMPADPAAAGAVRERLRLAGVGPADRLIVVHVSAGNPFRRWPQSAFAVVVAALVSYSEDTRVMVMSGPSEREAAARVVEDARRQLPASQQARVWTAEECSLSELRFLLDGAALYIGGDSGPLHIAATSPVPIVALYGPTLPVRSAPWRDRALITESVETAGLPCRPCDQRVCTPGDFRCLTAISPEMVIEAAERALGRSRRLPAAFARHS